jgi:hypothetical protein
MTQDLTKPCVDCGRPMLSHWTWVNRPELRPGRVRGAAKGRCHGCYARHRKQVRDGLDEDCDTCLRIPAAVRLDVEHLIAQGRRTSQIMAQLGVAYEVVAAVREHLARIEAA